MHLEPWRVNTCCTEPNAVLVGMNGDNSMTSHSKERLPGQSSGTSLLSFAAAEFGEPQLVTLPLTAIDPDPNQPRRTLGDLTDLALSIRQHGLLNPIIVEVAAAGRYRILAGERRFSACKSLGLDKVICIVRTVEEQSRLALQLIENMHRKDLSPVEEAQGMRRLMEEFNLTQRDLAQRVGKSLGAVNQTLRILDLDPELLAGVQTSEPMSKSVLLEIAKEADPQRQRELWEQAQAGRLTVREARTSKPRGSVSKAHTVTIALPAATVVVRFASGEPTSEQVAEVLRGAVAKVTECPASCSDV